MKKTWKSLVIAAVIGIFIFSTQSTQAKVQFNDLDEKNVHYNSIQQLVLEGVLSGYPDSDEGRVFKPNNELSRAHAAVMFSRYFGYDKDNQSLAVLSNYSDVDKSHTYAKEIAYVTEQGIFTGSAESFMPNEPLRRDQMATVIARAFELVKYERNESADVNVGNVYLSHKEGVKLLGQHGLTTELTDFRPNEHITRGQFATFLFRTSETNFTPIVIEDELEDQEETEEEPTPDEDSGEEPTPEPDQNEPVIYNSRDEFMAAVEPAKNNIESNVDDRLLVDTGGYDLYQLLLEYDEYESPIFISGAMETNAGESLGFESGEELAQVKEEAIAFVKSQGYTVDSVDAVENLYFFIRVTP